jgi:hypothetical protein
MCPPGLDPDLAHALAVLARVFAPDPPQVLTVAPRRPRPAAPAPQATQPRLPDLPLPPAPSTRRNSL